MTTKPTIPASITAVGPPGAPAIVFLHGTRLSRAAWTPQLDGLADEFRVIALDLPGHGSRAGEPFTLEAAAALVAATIRDEAADGRAVVVGLSLGGYVAMALAARDPGCVRGLVLAGATAEPVGVRSIPYRALAAVMDRFDGPRLDRLNAWFFRAPLPAGRSPSRSSPAGSGRRAARARSAPSSASVSCRAWRPTRARP